MSFPGRRSPYVDHILSSQACRMNGGLIDASCPTGRTRFERDETVEDLGRKLDEAVRIVEWKVSTTPPVAIDMVDNKPSIVHTLRQKKRPTSSVLGSLVIRGSSAKGQKTQPNPYMAWMQKTTRYQFLETPKPRPTPEPSDGESCFSISDLNDLSPTPDTSNDEDCLCPEENYRQTTDDLLDYYLNEEDDESIDLQIQPFQHSPVQRKPMHVVGSRVEYSGPIVKIQSKIEEPVVSNQTLSEDNKSTKKPRKKSGRLFMGKRVTASALRDKSIMAGSPMECFLNINSPATLNPKKSSVEGNSRVQNEAPRRVRSRSVMIASSKSMFCVNGRKYVPKHDLNIPVCDRKDRAKSAVVKSTTSGVNEGNVKRGSIKPFAYRNAVSTVMRPSAVTVTMIPM
ncbi:hypothetical protein CAPTEDRAFT_211730 [Capitella teleta]|uniref:Uncharacterized protein n=1 Tax=Capitella teleta TaxID=283909 RepID=R7T697_CAPTE|nr:hypothetical protein CAPTEDRAFT_211730 [Capitella teleta]|eukprot:ELT88950.1 hypothetical protein CAPTEDRAFT_211730 [Capitella teleta]